MYEFYFGELLDIKYELARLRDFDTRFTHCHIIGTSGSGKTTLMLRMALYDIKQGLACIFIDPKGQHTRELYSLIPDKSRVIYLSYANPCLTINPLRKKGYRLEDLIDEFVEILDVVIKVTSPINPPTSENMKEILHETIPAMREQDRDISQLYHFLGSKDARTDYFDRIGRSKPAFWIRADDTDKYGKLKNPDKAGTAAKIATRLYKYQGDQRMARLTSGENQLDIAELARHKKVLLVDTSEMTMEKRVLLTSLISFAVKSYCEFQKQAEYHPLMFYLDECWMGMNEKFQYLLSLGRSYRVGFTLAHQSMAQFYQMEKFGRNTLEVIRGNTSIKVAFSLRTKTDAQVMADDFMMNASELQKLAKRQAWVRIENENSPVDTYPPPKIEKLEAPPVMPLSDDRLPEEETTAPAPPPPTPEEPIPEAPTSAEPPPQPGVNFLKDCWFHC